MTRISLFATVIHTLWLVCLAAGPGLLVAEDFAAPKAPGITDALQEHSFRKAISSMESSQGAYASGLSEQLLSLGLTLQSQGRHNEAVDLFKRGVHLTRINDGLYSAEQIPLLQGQIASHVALGEYTDADDRQQYMYRVQVRSMTSGEPRAQAFMQQANWQHNAYRLRLGDLAFSRLMNMWDLYRLALNDIVTRKGDISSDLLPPLRGMLQAQYLISGYQPQSGSSGSGDDLNARQEKNRFNAYRAQSYSKGRAVIVAIHDIEQENRGAQSVEAAEALAMLGDWQLWHDQRQSAFQAYQEAMVELAERDDAQIQIDHLFGAPVALPNVDGVRPLPPEVATGQGDIQLEFGVNPRGRVVDLDRIDENDVSNGKANRLMRKLRKTKFRPRFEGGEPVGTEKIVKSYNIQ